MRSPREAASSSPPKRKAGKSSPKASRASFGTPEKEGPMAWLRRFSNVFRTGRLTGDIDREIAFHVAERAEQLRAEGLGEDEALRRARLQFGNPLVQRERARDVDVAEWLDTLLRSIRHAC